jgi:hypothetical protein
MRAVLFVRWLPPTVSRWCAVPAALEGSRACSRFGPNYLTRLGHDCSDKAETLDLGSPLKDLCVTRLTSCSYHCSLFAPFTLFW